MRFWAVRLVSLAVAFGVAFGADAWIAGSMPSAYRLAVLAGLFVTLAVSLNLINGITGQFSIGHAAFYMVGAYTTGFVSNQFYAQQPLGQPMWLIAMALLGAAAAAVAGLVVGLPSLRLRGDYLAIVTLGFGEILRIVTQNISQIGGSYGMNVKPFGGPVQTLWVVLLLAFLCVAVCRNLLKTAHGLPFVAVRDDEVASSAMGVRVSNVKVTAFVIGSAFAGAAGAMLAHAETFISPDMFRMDVSFIILTMVVLGGTGSITGSVVAAVVLFGIPEYLRTLQDPVTKLPLAVPGQALLGSLVAVGLTVWGLREVSRRVHGNVQNRVIAYGGTLLAGAIVAWLFSLAFGLIPQIAALKFDVNMLRMVIFALTLIVLMLLRPQGIFGHHEFSWRWLGGLLGRRAREAAA
jgi:branched-chain amino acid transport system permease protein